jgi:hypothetical protein
VTLIDQRILIAAPAEAIWQYLTLPNWLPKWHQGCKQVSLLSTRSGGVGARRRCIGADRSEVVEEITGWLDNIGYEYRVIDGPYRWFRGRFRLQPTAEGVIVNWTVEYIKRGLGSRLRDRLGGRRRVANQMAESLRALRKLVEKSGVRIDPEKQARYGMQRDPGFEARAARAGDVPRPEGAALRPVVIGEDDLPAALPTLPTPVPEPSFVSQLSSPPPPAPSLSASESSPKADTKPRKPKGLQEALERAGLMPPSSKGERYDPAKALTVPADLVAPKTPIPPAPSVTPPPAKPATLTDLNNAPTPPRGVPIPPKRESGTFAPVPADTPPNRETGALPPIPPVASIPSRPSAPTPPRGIPTPKRETGTLPPLGPVPPLAKRDTGAMNPVTKRDTGAMPAMPAVPPAANPPEGGPPPGPKPTTIHDTGELSIWDVFGVQRPSERTRTDLQTIIASLQAPIGRGRAFPTKTARRPTLRRKPIRVAARPPNPRRRERGERRIKAKTKVRVR